jgi:membrane protease YdiL (CAAX protease family)
MKEKATPTQRALNLWAFILIAWSFYRAYFRQDLPVYIDEFIVKPLFFIAPVYWFITRIERKPFAPAVFLDKSRIAGDLLLGGAFALAFFAAGLLSAYVKTGAVMIPAIATGGFFMTGLTALATAASEELLSRGFVLKRLYEDSKKNIRSILYASALFFFLHIPILMTDPGITGSVLLQVMATDFILSIAVSIVFLQRKSLVMAILMHALYTVVLSVFL